MTPRTDLILDTESNLYVGRSQLTGEQRFINVDYNRDSNLSEAGLAILKDRYLFEDERSPQEAFARVACAFSDDSAHAQRIYDYVSNNWCMFATPVLSNGGTERGLPISCFLNTVDDSREGLGDHYAENLWLSTSGGGIGTNWSDVRSVDTKTSKGNKTTGVIPFIKVVDSLTIASWQGSCYEEGTEVLTDKGFKDFRDVQEEDLVAQVNEKRQVTFTQPEELTVNQYDGDMYEFESHNSFVAVTENHRMVFERELKKRDGRETTGVLELKKAKDMKYHRDNTYHTSGSIVGTGNLLLSPLERFQIAFLVDGHLNKNSIEFHFSKTQKIERLREILTDLLVEFEEKHNPKTKITEFYVKNFDTSLISKRFFDVFSLSYLTTFEWCRDFLFELSQWDGQVRQNGNFTWVTFDKSNVDFVQAISSLCSVYCKITTTVESDGKKQNFHTVTITNDYKPISGYFVEKRKTLYSGLVYCCIVPEGRIIVRSRGKVSICGNTRRGATAVYLDVSHPEIEEFIEIRKPTGDSNRKSLNLHNAVTIPDAFMEAVEQGAEWDLIDPHTKRRTGSVDARTLWMKILATRVATGEPFLYFTDTANKALPKHLKDKGLKINNTNLCTEIMLPTSKERTAVCCLSSVNLEKYDEWKDNPLFIEDMLRMLDNVLQVFIIDAPGYMRKARFSAERERSVGLGAMGFHLFLQKKNVPFESVMASSWNRKIFADIQEKCFMANKKLGREKGEAPDAVGTGFRFSHTNAIAPNANISILCGNTSPSIEPFTANAFTQKTYSGVFLIKNKALDEKLRNKYNIASERLEEVWSSIIVNEGSVQHLDFLDVLDKEIFKTAPELDQNWIIEHAAARQPFIDQGQSVNVFIDPLISKADIHALHKSAWKKGLKSLYYCRSKSVGTTDVVSKGLDSGVVDDQKTYFNKDKEKECLSCEG